MIDRYEVGERQTSACAAPTEWLRALELEPSIRQTFDTLVAHTPHRTFDYRLPWTFSTFDYPELCALLQAQGDAEFETAKVNGITRFSGRVAGDGPLAGAAVHTVHTDRGDIRAPLVVDALGWKRVLDASAPIVPPHEGTTRPAGARTGTVRLSRGLEVHPPATGERPGDLDRPALHPRRVRMELSGARRAARRRRLVRAPRSRQAADAAARRRSLRSAARLPGQLDPASASPGRRPWRVLRRRLRRALPAAHRGGDSHRAVLRPGVRAGAARHAARGVHPGGRARPLRRVQRPSTPGSTARCCRASTSSGAPAASAC